MSFTLVNVALYIRLAIKNFPQRPFYGFIQYVTPSNGRMSVIDVQRNTWILRICNDTRNLTPRNTLVALQLNVALRV